MSTDSTTVPEQTPDVAAGEHVVEETTSWRPEVHFWLTKRDQGLLVVVCLALTATMAARAWQSHHFDASAHLPTIQEPDLNYRIDVNSASAEELQQLHLIGPKRALQIVTDREQRGPFATLDDLQRIKGIGPATVEKNRRWMRVGDDETIEPSAVRQSE